MRCAPPVGGAFSPLDDELALVDGAWTPLLHEQVVCLGAALPFGAVSRLLERLLGVNIAEASVRRRTEAAGAAYAAVQQEELDRLESGEPGAAPRGPERLLLSVDGAMVPVLGGAWAEVKTAAIGTLDPPPAAGPAAAPHAHKLSYFSRMTDHATFGNLATWETHRRGVATAGTVIAVVDGADWIQGFLDLHCPQAVRVVDWGHASSYVAQAGQALFGAGTAEASDWIGVQLGELRKGDPEQVLTALREALAQREAADAGADGLEPARTSLAYLEKRRTHLRYAAFTAAGYPIGSGSVESANKLVVEQRLKGSGMHWARPHVDPMLALRTALCSDRWDEAWAAAHQHLRRTAQVRAHLRRTARRQRHAVAPPLPAVAPPPPALPPPPPPAGENHQRTIVNGRPTPNHPWKLGYHARQPTAAAKL